MEYKKKGTPDSEKGKSAKKLWLAGKTCQVLNKGTGKN